MAILQGNTYLLPVKVLDCNDNELDINMVEKGEFTFGDLIKLYGEDGDVSWDENHKVFIVPLTEKETFAFEDLVEYQGRLLLKDGGVSGSIPKAEYVYKSIGKTILSEDGAGLQSGKILVMRLMKEFSFGGGTANYPDLDNLPSVNGVELVGNKTSEELGLASKDDIPVVPTKISAFENDAGYLKEVPSEYVTEEELNNKGYASTKELSDAIKDKATTGYVDQKVADLIGAAPETRDTLEELSKALEENEDVVDALNEAIGSKASQESVDELGDRVGQLENAGQPETNFIYLVGTEDKPINFYTDLEVGKGYIIKGYFIYNQFSPSNTYSNHFFAYKRSINTVYIYNYWIAQYKVTGAQNIISYITVDSTGKVTSSKNYRMLEDATSSGKILKSDSSYAPEWTSMSEITEFVDLANRVTTLEQGGGGGLDLIRVPKEA